MRARRRSDKERKKVKAKKLYPWCDCPGKLADNLTTCSGACCGNPRKWNKEPTRKEVLAARRLNEQLDEQHEFNEVRHQSDW